MKLNMFSAFGEKIKSLISKQSKLIFWNKLHPKLHFYAVCWHKQLPDDQTVQFWHQVSQQFWKLWLTRFFGTKLRGGQNFLFTMGGFSNEREYSGANWLDLLVIGKLNWAKLNKLWRLRIFKVSTVNHGVFNGQKVKNLTSDLLGQILVQMSLYYTQIEENSNICVGMFSYF